MSGQERDRIRILLVDDHRVLRGGLARVIQDEQDMLVVAEAEDGAGAVQSALKLRPDVVLMDIGLPGDVSGIDATKQIVEAAPEIRVLMLTVYDREDLLVQALQAGAYGYIVKGADMSALLQAIRTVASGEVYVYPTMATKLVRGYLRRAEAEEPDDGYRTLSAREREVLPLLAEERSDVEISRDLNLSPYTIHTYRQRIMQKLDLHSRAELVRYAIRRGIIRP